MGGDFEHSLVLDDAAAGKIALLRRSFAPGRNFAQDAKETRVDATAQAKAAPRLVRIGAIGRRIAQYRYFLGEPRGPAVGR